MLGHLLLFRSRHRTRNERNPLPARNTVLPAVGPEIPSSCLYPEIAADKEVQSKSNLLPKEMNVVYCAIEKSHEIPGKARLSPQPSSLLLDGLHATLQGFLGGPMVGVGEDGMGVIVLARFTYCLGVQTKALVPMRKELRLPLFCPGAHLCCWD